MKSLGLGFRVILLRRPGRRIMEDWRLVLIVEAAFELAQTAGAIIVLICRDGDVIVWNIVLLFRLNRTTIQRFQIMVLVGHVRVFDGGITKRGNGGGCGSVVDRPRGGRRLWSV